MNARVPWIIGVAALFLLAASTELPDGRFAQRIVDPAAEAISMHWKNDSGEVIGNIGGLQRWLGARGRTLRFAMNGGMYTKTFAPVGLYVEEGRILKAIDRRTEGKDNFHMQPNGVFGILSDGSPFVRRTAEMKSMLDVRFATQSGPMLVTDGAINPLFTPGSKNVHIRNGVGVMPDGRVLFAISREPVNFHDFASYFLDQGCSNALYLDGFVSKAFIPEVNMAEMDGQLGVLIAVSEAN